jgi:hypothetical protein
MFNGSRINKMGGFECASTKLWNVLWMRFLEGKILKSWMQSNLGWQSMYPYENNKYTFTSILTNIYLSNNKTYTSSPLGFGADGIINVMLAPQSSRSVISVLLLFALIRS